MRRLMVVVVSTACVALLGCSSGGGSKDKKDDSTAPVSSGAAPVDSATAQSGPHEAPFNPYANVTPGDWVCMVVRAKYDGDAGKDAYPSISVWTWTVGDATTDDSAAILLATNPAIEGLNGTTKPADRKNTPKLENDFFPIFDKAVDATFEDDKKTLGDREFACRKVSLSSADTKLAAWFSSDVKVKGLVWVTQSSPVEKAVETLDLELVGFGTKETVVWGKKPEDVAAELLQK